MDYTTYEQLVDQYEWPKEIEAKSLYRALEQVKDGRGRRGVRYSVAFVVSLLLSPSPSDFWKALPFMGGNLTIR